jgi:hypothetical protein
LKINGMIIALMALSIAAVFCGPALAVDPRAEVPGATITGVILDASGHSIPNATVKLFLDGQLFDVPGNPQQSNDIVDPYIAPGRYLFRSLPYGQYMITAEIGDAAGMLHQTNLSVAVNATTVTADLVISDLVISPPATPSPSPVYPPTVTPYREPCGLGLVFPVLGSSLFIIGRKKIK